MECMCAPTKSRFILSSKRGFKEWSQDPCKLQGKSPVYQRSEEGWTHDTAQRRTHAQNTTNWAIPDPNSLVSSGWMKPDSSHRLTDLVVKVSASGAEDPGFQSHLQWDFSRLSHTSDLKIGTPVATLRLAL